MTVDKLLELLDTDRNARIDAVTLLRLLRKHAQDPYTTRREGAPSTVGLSIMDFESRYGATILETSL